MVLRAPASQAAPLSAPLGPTAVPHPEEAEMGHAGYQGGPSVDAGRRPVAPQPGAAASTVPNVGNGLRRIFREMTGAGMKRQAPPPPTPAPTRSAAAAPTPHQPDAGQGAGGGAQRQMPAEDIGLDIPTFLRRQSNN